VKLCLHWIVPLWSLYYWYNICTKLLHLEAMWYEIKAKIYFEWISHKCKMLFNILFSIHLTSLFFVIYPFESVHSNSPVVTVLYIWLRVGGGYGKYFFFFSLSVCEYWNVSYHLLNQSPYIHNLQAYYTFFSFPCILCSLLPCVSIFTAFFIERMAMLCSLFVSWLCLIENSLSGTERKNEWLVCYIQLLMVWVLCFKFHRFLHRCQVIFLITIKFVKILNLNILNMTLNNFIWWKKCVTSSILSLKIFKHYYIVYYFVFHTVHYRTTHICNGDTVSVIQFQKWIRCVLTNYQGERNIRHSAYVVSNSRPSSLLHFVISLIHLRV